MGLNDRVYERFLKAKNKAMSEDYYTNEGYKIKVVNYIDRHNVIIEFQDEYKFKTKTTMQNIRKGQVKNPYKKTIYGLGYYGVGEYTSRINGIKTEPYIKWFSMFNRCYDENYLAKNPSYKGCEVDESFQCFQDFAQWYEENLYEYDGKLELDKDLLVKGNRTYGKQYCCLLPKEINNALKYKRDNREYMRKIYEKYKFIVPNKILDKLKELI